MKHKKLIIVGIIVIAVVLIISALSNSTYALFSSDDYGANPNVYSTGNLSIEAKSKSDVISLNNVLPMSDEKGKETIPYIFTIKNTGTVNYKFNVKLLSTGNSSTSFSSNYIKLQIDEGNVTTLSSLTSSMIKEDVVLIAGETVDISIRIWLDEETPNSEIGKSFNSKIVIDGQSVYTVTNNLVNYISSLYTPNDTAENNGITYNLDTTHYLMNDRLGTNTVGIDNGNIRYYGATPNNYIDIGDTYEEDIIVNNWEELLRQVNVPESMIPTNSYGCKQFMQCSNLVPSFFDNEDTCKAQLPYLIQQAGFSNVNEFCSTTTVIAAGTPKLYRIIGLFKDVKLSDGTKKDLVKVVRNEIIGNYSWDQSPSNINNGFGINEWSQADLMKLLNPYNGDETVGVSLYWNSGSGNCYGYDAASQEYKAIPCDFKNTGLNSNVHNKIEEVYWNLGGWNNNNVYPNQIYEYERLDNVVVPGTTCSGDWCNDKVERTIMWPGKVALAYPSDYGYAVDLDSCDTILDNYSNCIGTNWMHNILTKNEMYSSWLLTPDSSGVSNAWLVNGDGIVLNGYAVFSTYGVSPVFYLDSALGIVSGDGSIDTPFVVR